MVFYSHKGTPKSAVAELQMPSIQAGAKKDHPGHKITFETAKAPRFRFFGIGIRVNRILKITRQRLQRRSQCKPYLAHGPRADQALG